MPFQSDSILPTGGLNKDLDLSLIPKGDYLDALNIQHISDGGSTSFAIQNTRGNILRFTIPDTVAQNKTIRVSGYGADGVYQHRIRFFYADGTIMANAVFTEGATLALTIAAAQASITAALAAAFVPQTVTYTSGPGNIYFELTITTTLGLEYSAASLGVLPFAEKLTLLITKEAILPALAGQHNIIGSYDLLGDLFILSTPCTDNVGGVGEIGVVTHDANTDTTTYYTLLKSKEFKFTTKHQIDTYAEENNFQRSIYWTDDFNIPRVFYYSGVYLVNGGLTYINPDGLYEYGSISDETKMILTNEQLGFSFIQQIEGGGAIRSGNWRYSVRLLTATFSATNWTEISNPINVYRASTTGNPQAIFGDDAGTLTSKINQFQVTGIPSDIFSFIELAAVNYVGLNAIVGSIVNRIAVTGPSMIIEHTGTENGAVNLDIPTLNQFSFDIQTARNIDAIDNRLVLSNLTTAQAIDFSDWTKTWEHSIERKTIDSIGDFGVNDAYGEYQVPLNVYDNVGYMHNDVYRFTAKLTLKSNGNFTNTFWVDDIKIDVSATNITVPSRRVAGTFTDYNLTPTGTPSSVYVTYVKFSNINLDFLIGGIPARDLVEFIHFERAERIPEVLVTGPVIATVTGFSLAGYGSQYYGPAGPPPLYGEYPYVSGILANVAAPGIALYPSAFTAHVLVAKMESPDVFCGKSAYPSYLLGDKFLSYGNGELTNLRQEWGGSPAYVTNNLAQYNGFYNPAGPSLISIPLTSTLTVDTGQGATAFAGITYDQILDAHAPAQWTNRNGLLMACVGAPFFNPGINPDYGFYYGQYYREIAYTPGGGPNTDPNTCKYGNINETVSVPTGAIFDVVPGAPAIVTQDVFGGDTFTQKGYIKHRGAQVASGSPVSEGGGGLGFFSQNTVNVQMIRRDNQPSTAWVFPNPAGGNNSVTQWLKTSDLGTTIAPYNQGYNIQNGISADAAFDPNLPDQNDLPTEIRYSDLKPQNSVADNFRVFLPLNFKDLPQTFGEITHHANYNGELFTWQPRMVQRQYFNTRGTMQVDAQAAATDVLIGDGSVFSRDGMMVTRVGTNNKWSVIKGKSSQGNDTMYWINTELKKAMRLGYDGSVSIADIHGMQSFLANNLNWVDGKDTPADGEGICGVWDDRYIAAIWTMRGKRVVGAWDVLEPYFDNAVVSFTPSTFSTFEKTGEFYVAASANLAKQPDSFPLIWILIPHTGSVTVNNIVYNSADYYNEYTIEFNEQKNKFTTFYTFKPKIYLKWTDTFLTPRPVSNTAKVYEHRLGDFCVWYDDGVTDQRENGSITFVYNQNMNNSKMFKAFWMKTELVPFRMDIYTRRHQSFLLAADFENNLDYFTAAIKNDILTSSNGLINDEDTTGLFGSYVEIKMTFEAGVFQKAVDMIVKFFAQSRMPNK